MTSASSTSIGPRQAGGTAVITLGDQRASIGVQARALQRLDALEVDIGLENRFFFLQNYRE